MILTEALEDFSLSLDLMVPPDPPVAPPIFLANHEVRLVPVDSLWCGLVAGEEVVGTISAESGMSMLDARLCLLLVVVGGGFTWKCI